MKKKSVCQAMEDLKAPCQLLTGFTLIINQGEYSREAQSSIYPSRNNNALQRGPWINISAALQSDTALPALWMFKMTITACLRISHC